jgi:arginase family enzyme
MTGTGGQVVVLGAPYDRGGPQFHAGCWAAPAALREASHPSTTNAAKHGLFDHRRHQLVFESSAVSDLGDIPFRPTQTDDEYLAFLANAVRLIGKEGKKPLLLGGDHLVTLAALRGLRASVPEFQLVHVDAHHDFEEIREGARPTHASFIGYAVAEALVTQVVQIGVRGLSGGFSKSPSGVRQVAVHELVDALTPGAPVYLSVDTDAFDPVVAAAVNYPEPEGLTLGDFRSILNAISTRSHLVGADWTEYNPSLDTKNRVTGRFIVTALAATIQDLLK